ncbi:hypothetical protein SteCoe_15415 [Stentor coeruleus]|uniref:EF-hand domain-containing protein n=1 Tax=Stentor coeruleus TaxID=5963 RepID=A0A1R2C3P1_9CILI|nr:hypothetical protein SteCoe_15415 [Stentor coeruleus]
MLNSDNSEFNLDTKGTEKRTYKKKSIEKFKSQRKSLETEGSESRINRKHLSASNKNPSPRNQKKNIKEKSKIQVYENRKTPGFYSRRDSSDQGPSFFFQPKVNSSFLSKDPIKRFKVNNTTPTYDTKRCLSPKSEQVLIKKFESEFNRISKDLDFDSSGMLNYSKFCQILGKMNFIHQNMIKPNERELILKAWKILGGNDSNKVHKKNLSMFLLAVMNLVKKTRASSNDAIFAGTKKNQILLSAESVKKIHKDFYDLFQNRRNLSKITLVREKSSGSSKFVTRRASENTCEDFVSENYRKNYAVKVSMPDTAEVIVDGTEEKIPEPRDTIEGTTEVFRTMPSTHLLDTEIDELAVNRSLYSFSRPKLSIPKIAKHKSISLRSNSCSSETTLLKIQFTYHSCSPVPITKKSKSSSVITSESEGDDLSLINPLVTPPSQLYKDTQVMNFVNSSISSPSKLRKKSSLNEKNPSVNEFIVKNSCKTSKRYKCQSPESCEDMDESFLITVVLPDSTEQYLRLHKNHDINTVLKSFGNKYNLKEEQLTKLKTEILVKLKISNI